MLDNYISNVKSIFMKLKELFWFVRAVVQFG